MISMEMIAFFAPQKAVGNATTSSVLSLMQASMPLLPKLSLSLSLTHTLSHFTQYVGTTTSDDRVVIDHFCDSLEVWLDDTLYSSLCHRHWANQTLVGIHEVLNGMRDLFDVSQEKALQVNCTVPCAL